jgi:acetolactate synthase-1/2/3 large subunit
MLLDEVEVGDVPRVEPAETWPAPAQMAELQRLLEGARRPLAILGGSRWTEAARAELIAWSERWSLPVATSFRRTPLFPADHPNYAGDVGIGPNPKLAARVKEADLLLLIGGRMSEMPSSSYTLLDIPVPAQRLVHVHPGVEELGRVYAPTLAIHASPGAFCAALRAMSPTRPPSWHEEATAAHAAYRDWSERPAQLPGAFQYGEAMVWLRERLPLDAVICSGAGNFSIWIHRYYRFRGFGSQLAPTSGSMGYGVPAAVMAKRQQPGRIAVALAGDGDFMMNGQEFATAVQYDCPIVVVVLDNGMYGTIRMHQEREFPGRVVATGLKNPDFAAMARAFGGHGERVERTEEFAPAFERALASGLPAILHCIIDPQALTPAATLDTIRERALAKRGNEA